ncbi:brefeldin A-inhibited guanine nucleotide-exchange protein 2 isoform X2 [Cryptomeria japonica]|uniref:brefeldin A-inhibited guanine nucleotide-exchange protein 2 isoform X2 n=1 Tax=Cryptomeria japonica TaxID=3369 RepID=UPI0025AD8229|nr:brefeldin A-inhibited guanine nucleotide-exchange protein 2 isoform X2 [Cryptomeria japonica]
MTVMLNLQIFLKEICRMVNGLLKTAQGVHPGAATILSPVQDATFKLEAIKCLVGICRSMGVWMNRQLHMPDSQLPRTSVADDQNSDTTNTSPANGTGEDAANGVQLLGETNKDISEAATFEQRRAYKLELQEGISLFNRKPGKGIEFLVNAKKIGDTPEEIATFLKKASGLNQTMIGDYLGEREGLPLRVMHAYADSFDFEGMEFDQAIRSFLQGFRLPGEAQKIDRIMEKFSERYCKCYPKAFSSADTAYVLAYSVILLNTDAHNPMVKNKMSKADFLRNNRGIDDGKDLPEGYLGSLYDRIVKSEIKMKADTLTLPSKQPTNENKILGLDSILNLVIRKRGDEKVMQKNDELIRHMQEQFKAKTGKSESVYHAATDIEILRFMLEVCWAPMLAAFSVTLGQTDDEVSTFECLQGFRYAIQATAVMGMQTQRDAFVTSLAKFTSLHSAADIKQKNIGALKAIITIADEDGNYLQGAWEHILTCLSRFEQLHLLGEGAPPDATFFTVPQNELEKIKHPLSPVFHSQKRKGAGQLQHAVTAGTIARRGSYDSVGVGGNASGIVTPEQMNNLVSNLNMLEQIGNFEMNCIFVHSERLNSEAIVDFVKALCKVSIEELRSPTDPRVFSLTKIVEIAHYNMNRIRLVWSRIWNVLSSFFVTVGCSENLSIAIFVMDSLRQLAMKFLEREELANYNFQNEFMKPFVIVIQQSSSIEIRELVIRCVSQMVLARVNNIKSGWKSMFMVFTIAAADDHKNIVLLAFETIEKIVRDYFPYIIETETTTFTDCVNCLIAFMNTRFNKDISLNAIAFLRFCALKLAEGRLISSLKNKDKEKFVKPGVPLASGCNGDIDSPKFTDKDDHLSFWSPLLAGFSKLTFDPRPDIRKSALQTLFDTLQHHGHLFSPALWERVFESVLFPLFFYVPHDSSPVSSSLRSNDLESKYTDLNEDDWISDTFTLALQLVVDLFVKFYPLVNLLLGNMLKHLTTIIKRPIQNLAGIGVSAFIRLMNNAGTLFSDDEWQQVLSFLKTTAEETVPEFAQIVYIMADIETSDSAEEDPTKSSNPVFVNGTISTQEAENRDENRLRLAVSDAKCRTAVQLLLIQVIMEIHNRHGERLSAANTIALLDIPYSIAVHAHNVNSDYPLRLKVQEVNSITQMPDPPLLSLESESYQAFLKLLQNVAHDKPILAKEIEVESRLVQLCEDVLQVYINAATPEPFSGSYDDLAKAHRIIPLHSARRSELASRAPLVVATLQAISQLKIATFKRYLSRLFPLLSSLISCEHGTGEVQLALSNILSSCIGQILLQA